MLELTHFKLLFLASPDRVLKEYSSSKINDLVTNLDPYINIFLPTFNRPFLSSKNPHFQNKCETSYVKMSFICMRNKNYFHIKDFTLSLVLINRLEATWK